MRTFETIAELGEVVKTAAEVDDLCACSAAAELATICCSAAPADPQRVECLARSLRILAPELASDLDRWAEGGCRE